MIAKIKKYKVQERDANPNIDTEIACTEECKISLLSQLSYTIDKFFANEHAKSYRELVIYYDQEEISRLSIAQKILETITEHINVKYRVVSPKIYKKEKSYEMVFPIVMQDSDAINTFGDKDVEQILCCINDALIQHNISPLTDIEVWIKHISL